MSLGCTSGTSSERPAGSAFPSPLLTPSHAPHLFSSSPPPPCLEVCRLKLTFMFLFLCWFCASFSLPHPSPPALVSRIKLVSRSVAFGIRSRTFSLGKSWPLVLYVFLCLYPPCTLTPRGRCPRPFHALPFTHLFFSSYVVPGPCSPDWEKEDEIWGVPKECRELLALPRAGEMLPVAGVPGSQRGALGSEQSCLPAALESRLGHPSVRVSAFIRSGLIMV